MPPKSCCQINFFVISLILQSLKIKPLKIFVPDILDDIPIEFRIFYKGFYFYTNQVLRYALRLKKIYGRGSKNLNMA